MSPVLRRVELPPEDILRCLAQLYQTWTLPDDTEIIDQRTMRHYAEQIQNGYFYRLEFVNGETAEQVLAWYNDADQILTWHSIGIL